MSTAAAVLAGAGDAPSTPAAVPTSAAPPASPATPAPASTPASLYGGADNDVRTFIDGKHFSSTDDIAQSYYNAQKLIGTPHERLIKVPVDPADPAWKTDVWSKLGMPETPEKYDFGDIQPAEGAPDILTPFKGWAHELGLNNAQAKGIVEKFEAHMQEVANAQEAEKVESQAAREKAEHAQIRKEYGAQYAEAALHVEAALARFGVHEDLLVRMMNGEATRPELFKFFADIGRATGEHRTPASGNGAGSWEGSPAWAAQKLNELRGDKAFMDAWVRGEPSAKQRMDEITRLAHPS